MTWTRHWKVERQQAPWNPFQDTPEALQDAIRHGAMFATVLALDGPPGDAKTNRRGPLVFDFDCKDDPALALIEMVWILNRLQEDTGLDPESAQIFLSGGKGGHIVIPLECFGGQPDPYLHQIHKRIAEQLQKALELETLDLSMYAGGRGKMFRLPNVRRGNGRYKVPITWAELLTLTADELLSLTEAPRTLKRGRS